MRQLKDLEPAIGSSLSHVRTVLQSLVLLCVPFGCSSFLSSTACAAQSCCCRKPQHGTLDFVEYIVSQRVSLSLLSKWPPAFQWLLGALRLVLHGGSMRVHCMMQEAACLAAALADRAFTQTMMRCPSLAEAEGES